MITVYGIANCDSIRKTRQWLDAHDVPYDFHDYRKQGLDAALCDELLGALPLSALINTRGTTWRGLPEQLRVSLEQSNAAALMQAWPAVIRRPLIRAPGGWLCSADPVALNSLLADA